MTRKEYMQIYHRKWYRLNKAKVLARSKSSYRRNRKAILEKHRKSEKYRKYRKQRYAANAVQLRAKSRAYYYQTRDRSLARAKAWASKNRDKIRKRERERRRSDPNFRMAKLLRQRLRQLVSGRNKRSSVLVLLGCSLASLRTYLEAKFKPGMNWSNFGAGGWEIDHERPCASFDLTKHAEQKRCFHYTNLQPLWWRENRIKHAKLSA